jgi:hypothetical protein
VSEHPRRSMVPRWIIWLQENPGGVMLVVPLAMFISGFALGLLTGLGL